MKSKTKNDDARIRLPRDLFREIQHAAIDCGAGVSATTWIVNALREALPPEKKGES